ncbi:MAG TPA: 6-phosphogluconate dehydrogenase (decarboxylating), partial [Aquifex aeolicus]|nr:6-phosphogluconate dehydrogenase (decarboxylating) [Aquifex aeolicus]
MKEIGIVGLGRMGLGIGERLKDRGWKVFGYDKDETALSRAEDRGLEVFENLEFLCGE